MSLERRQYPHNLDAERSVLGSMLLEPECVCDIRGILEPEEFYQVGHQVMCSCIYEMFDQGERVDITGLVDLLRRKGRLDEVGGYLYIASLEQFVLASSAAPSHARLVREKYQLRKIMVIAETILHEASEERTSASDMVQKAHEMLFKAEGTKTGKAREQTLKDILLARAENSETRSQLRKEGQVDGIAFALKDLDKVLGGLQPSSLSVIAAATSVGKTALALHLYRECVVTQGLPAAFFELEMDNEELGDRVICSLSGVNLDKMQKGFSSREERDIMRAVAKDVPAENGFHYECAGLTAIELLGYIRKLKVRVQNLAMVVVDHLGLMRHPEGKGTNKAQAIGETTRLLKQIANQFKIQVVLLHQLNRGKDKDASQADRNSGAGGRPTLADLRDSGRVEEDANLILLLHRAKFKDPKTASTADPTDLEIIVAKNRRGPLASVHVHYNLETQQLSDRMKGAHA